MKVRSLTLSFALVGVSGCWAGYLRKTDGPSGCVVDEFSEEEKETGLMRMPRRSVVPLENPQLLQWARSEGHEARTDPMFAETASSHSGQSEYGGPRRNGNTFGDVPKRALAPLWTIERSGLASRPDSSPAGAVVIVATYGWLVVRWANGVELYERQTGGRPHRLVGARRFDESSANGGSVPGLATGLEFMRDVPVLVLPSSQLAFAGLDGLGLDHDPEGARDFPSAHGAPPLDDGAQGYRCDLLTPMPGQHVLTVHHLAEGGPQDSRWRLEAAVYDPLGQRSSLYGDGIRRVAAGVDSTGVVIATDKGVVWTNAVLQPTREFVSPLSPVSLSTGEDDSSYVTNEDPVELLRFDVNGDAIFRTSLPGVPTAHPPATMADGGAVVAMRDRIVCVSPQGKLRWQAARDSDTPVFVDPKGNVLTSDDTRAIAIDADGSVHVLWEAADRLISAPTQDEHGLWVATHTHLYLLTAGSRG